MARNSQQSARLVQSLVAQAYRRLGVGGLVAVAVLALAYLFVEPMLEARLRVDLPGIHTPDESLADAPPPTSRPSAESTSNSTDPPPSGNPSSTESSPATLGDVLEEIGRDTYRSSAGLVYTRGSVHRTRLAHLKSHTVDDADREGSHGVFDETDMAKLILLVDEVYLKGLKGGRVVDRRREGARTVYTVDMHRPIGTIGGKSGARQGHPPARHIRLVVEGEKFITAFPLIP